MASQGLGKGLLQPGDYVLMDPTDEHTRELLPASESDQSYLVCRPEGENIRLSPVQPAERNLLRVKTTGLLSAAGTLATSFYLVLYLEVDQILWLMFAVSVLVGAAAWLRPAQAVA